MSKESIDALVAKLTSKDYQSADELAKDFADGMAGIARQPGADRGLKDNTLADVQGGTTLGVGDPAAGHISDYLVQNPQPGVANNVGSGLQTRRQTRIETETKTLPAIVVTDAVAGDTTVRVKIAGDGATKATDDQTGVEVVGNLTVGDGTEYDASMTGLPIVNDGENGIQPIEAGRTVNVVVSRSYEVTSTNTKRYRKNLPVITRVLKSETVCLVNGFACNGAGGVCIPIIDAASSSENKMLETDPPSDGENWVYDTGNTFTPGRPWAVVEFNTGTPNGTLDRNLGDFDYYAYGTVNPDGTISFTEVPYSQAYTDGHFYIPRFPATDYIAYAYMVLIGCATGQSVNFGTVDMSRQDGTNPKSWTVIDSDFPIPL